MPPPAPRTVTLEACSSLTLYDRQLPITNLSSRDREAPTLEEVEGMASSEHCGCEVMRLIDQSTVLTRKRKVCKVARNKCRWPDGASDVRWKLGLSDHGPTGYAALTAAAAAAAAAAMMLNMIGEVEGKRHRNHINYLHTYRRCYKGCYRRKCRTSQTNIMNTATPPKNIYRSSRARLLIVRMVSPLSPSVLATLYSRRCVFLRISRCSPRSPSTARPRSRNSSSCMFDVEKNDCSRSAASSRPYCELSVPKLSPCEPAPGRVYGPVAPVYGPVEVVAWAYGFSGVDV